jgi:hypothetical protein
VVLVFVVAAAAVPELVVAVAAVVPEPVVPKGNKKSQYNCY